MAFTYRAEVTLPQAPDFGEQLVAHCSGLGFRLSQQDEGEWTFRRGHKLAFLYRFDIRAYATTLSVRAVPLPEGDIQVRWQYEVWTFGNALVTGDIACLEAEVAQFVAACLPLVKEPRDLMSVSHFPGQYLPLWLLLLVGGVVLLLAGYVVGAFLASLHR